MRQKACSAPSAPPHGPQPLSALQQEILLSVPEILDTPDLLDWVSRLPPLDLDLCEETPCLHSRHELGCVIQYPNGRHRSGSEPLPDTDHAADPDTEDESPGIEHAADPDTCDDESPTIVREAVSPEEPIAMRTRKRTRH